jgi:sulfane dehydrogenase subunit SoxC
MPTQGLNEDQREALWQRAERAGLTRRKFVLLLAGGGAVAVLTACAPRVTTTVTNTVTATPTNTTPSATPTPTSTPAAERLVDEPTPAQFFLPIGGGNFEMRFEDMANRTYQTPNSLFFVRDHTSTPVVDVATWKLSVEGDGINNPFTITYDDLLKMPSTTVTRYVECAGNGRSFFASLLSNAAQGGQWHLGAYGIADWTGVKLSTLLNRAGLKSSAVDVMPVGLDSTNVRRPMPVDKAMQDDTLLVYMMNGDLLPIDHGFPARVIAPGWVGVSNIKWVGSITVSTSPIFVDKNTTSYVLVGPDYAAQGQALGPAVTTQVMKSAICLPFPATLAAGQQKIAGYAWSPNGKISAVDVSLDGGKTFQSATLVGPNIEKAGSRWEFTFQASAGNMTITPRATDDKNNVQYDISKQKWNQMGYLFGAMVPHPVTVV